MAIAFAMAIVASATAQAANYRMLLCAGNNGSNGFETRTNTKSAQNPAGIFNFENYCGPAPYPAGDNAFLRIAENQSGGVAGFNAYGSMSWDVSPWVSILAGGGYTREPGAFNDGWRGRFWAEGWDGSTNNILMQGTGAANSGINWSPTSTFASHLWPFGGYGDYKRFVFEMTCMREAGCDRTNVNAVDANTIVLILSDKFQTQINLTNTNGPLLSGQWTRGDQSVSFSWSDEGSGIRFERIRIDGSDRFVIDHQATGECNTGSSQAIGEFARVFQPCATASNIQRSYTFDTASLSDGAHLLQACAQDYAQYQGLNGTGGESCDQRTVRTDNSAPGKPASLQVTSGNSQRYLDSFGAKFALPPNQGSPVTKIHYEVVDAAGKAVVPEKVFSGSNPTSLSDVVGPTKAGAYSLRVWLEDQVGLVGPAATAPIPHDTIPPAAPQSLQVTAPSASRSQEGFDVRWHNVTDAGSPISLVHYQVLNAAGGVIVPTQTIAGDNPQEIQSLETPEGRGSYLLKLWLEDAEGNVGVSTTAPMTYECMRSSASSGSALTSGLGDSLTHEEVVQQGSGSIFRGKLSGAGSGIGDASICMFSRVVTKQQREFLGVAVTDANGGYEFAIPAGASRELTALYRSGSREVASRSTVQTVVHPSFGVRKRIVRNKHAARFIGSIPGPDNNRVVVVLQVKRGKGWLAFRRYRTRENGQVTVGYRFSKTNVATKYRMRLQVRNQSGYPYLQGDSDPLTLIVLPSRHRHAAARTSRRPVHCQDGDPAKVSGSSAASPGCS